MSHSRSTTPTFGLIAEDVTGDVSIDDYELGRLFDVTIPDHECTQCAACPWPLPEHDAVRLVVNNANEPCFGMDLRGTHILPEVAVSFAPATSPGSVCRQFEPEDNFGDDIVKLAVTWEETDPTHSVFRPTLVRLHIFTDSGSGPMVTCTGHRRFHNLDLGQPIELRRQFTFTPTNALVEPWIL